MNKEKKRILRNQPLVPLVVYDPSCRRWSFCRRLSSGRRCPVG